VLFTLSPDVIYLVAVGSTDDSHSKMGGYALRVAPAPAQEVPSLYGKSDTNGRWLSASWTDLFFNEFDRTRITRTTHGTYLFWQRATYRTPYTSNDGNTYDSTMKQYEISCSDLRYRVLSRAEYLKSELVSSSSESTSWLSAMPETVAEASGQVICAYVKAHGIWAAHEVASPRSAGSSQSKNEDSERRKLTEARMIITDDDFEIARERAEALLRGRTEDARWNVLRAALVESNSQEREVMLANLTLDAVRDLLYPGIDRDRWRKLGWSNVLGGRLSPDDFIHKLRLAKGTGSSSGKL
jgi:hypothetical protein